MQTYLEIILFLGALAVVGDLSHFTWWGVLFLCALNTVSLFDSERFLFLKQRLAIATLVNSTTITATVVIMSIKKCDLLLEALNEVGDWPYFLGNFALHYYPSLRSLHFFLVYKPTQTYFDAALVLAAYFVMFQPNTVYGCHLTISYILAPVGLLWSLFIEAFYIKCFSNKT